MGTYTYTKREMQIIKRKQPMDITDEEFLAVYNKAYHRNHIKYIMHLGEVYPDIEEWVFSYEFEEQHNDPADRENIYMFPILCQSGRNTEGRIRNMTAYLLGKLDWTSEFRKRLYALVPYRLDYNYWLEEYVKNYEAVPLWEDYFKGHEELSHMIELHSISSLDELEYRASEYFEQCMQGSRRGAQNKMTAREQKPRYQVFPVIRRRHILSGVWNIHAK